MVEAAERVYGWYVEDGLYMKVPFLGVGMQYDRNAIFREVVEKA